MSTWATMAAVLAARNVVRLAGVASTSARVRACSSPAVAAPAERMAMAIRNPGATTDIISAFTQPAGVPIDTFPSIWSKAAGRLADREAKVFFSGGHSAPTPAPMARL
jgi:hypothetical protein